jgi:hypothetical protein
MPARGIYQKCWRENATNLFDIFTKCRTGFETTKSLSGEHSSQTISQLDTLYSIQVLTCHFPSVAKRNTSAKEQILSSLYPSFSSDPFPNKTHNCCAKATAWFSL